MAPTGITRNKWMPFDVLTGDDPKALIILNQPLERQSRMLVKRHWDSAGLRIAADGGLLHLKELDDKKKSFIPDIVCGDFDSLTEDMLNEYSSLGSEIVRTPDQDETDFTKALHICLDRMKGQKLKISCIVVFSNNGHRLDHVMANLNTLYRAVEWSSVPIYLVGEQSVTWVLSVGKHEITMNKQFTDTYIGLIPLGSPCKAVTSGLKWNVAGDEMKFGDLVSTSNGWNGTDHITVNNNSPLIFTMSFNLSLE